MTGNFRHDKVQGQTAFLSWIEKRIEQEPAVTREKFARATGITVGKLDALERGDDVLSLDRACRMAMLLGDGIWTEWKERR